METNVEIQFPLCIFCYKSTNASENTFSQANNIDGNKVEIVTRFFTLICRHFNCGSQKDARENRNNTSEKLACLFNGVNFGSVLKTTPHVCESCTINMEDFLDLYHQMKCLELRVSCQVNKFRNIMKCADKVPARVKQFRESRGVGSQNNTDKLIVFRKNFKRCCKSHQKRTFPRVLISSNLPTPSLANETENGLDTHSTQDLSGTESNDELEVDDVPPSQPNEQIELVTNEQIEPVTNEQIEPVTSEPFNEIPISKSNYEYYDDEYQNSIYNSRFPDKSSSSHDTSKERSREKFGCEICGITLTSSHHLNWHMNENHSNSKEYEEKIRAKFLNIISQNMFPKALPKLAKENEVEMEPAPTEKATSSFLKTLWKCNICKSQFSSEHWLQVHQKETHADADSSNCTFQKIEQEKKITATNIIRKKFKCNFCGFVVLSKKLLKNHKHLKHKLGTKRINGNPHGVDKLIQCRGCPKEFYYVDRNRMKQHEAYAHPYIFVSSWKSKHITTDQFKLYVWSLVNQEVNKLKQTIDKRSGKYKFKCLHCSKHLCDKKYAKMHVIIKHPEIVGKKVKKMQRTTTPEELQIVKPSLTGKTGCPTTLHPKTTKSSYCGYTFSNGENLRRHVKRCNDRHVSNNNVNSCNDSDQSALSLIAAPPRPTVPKGQFECTDEFITGGCEEIETKMNVRLLDSEVVSTNSVTSSVRLELKQEHYEMNQD